MNTTEERATTVEQVEVESYVIDPTWDGMVKMDVCIEGTDETESYIFNVNTEDKDMLVDMLRKCLDPEEDETMEYSDFRACIGKESTVSCKNFSKDDGEKALSNWMKGMDVKGDYVLFVEGGLSFISFGEILSNIEEYEVDGREPRIIVSMYRNEEYKNGSYKAMIVF